MRILTTAFAALVLAAPAFSAPAAAQTFDFEDLVLPPVNMATGLGLVQQEIGAYRGFDFFGIGAMSTFAPVVGAANAASSGSQYAYVGSDGLGALYRFDLRNFNFYSAFLSFQPTTGMSEPAEIIIRGYRAGDIDASVNRVLVLGSTATQYDFNIRGLEQLEFATVTGSGYIAIDDLNVATVPEPISMALLASGLAGIAIVRLRRRTV